MLITRFTVVFENMFQFLSDMAKHGLASAGYVALTDHTFKLEWMGCAWGMTGIVFFRAFGGRWRKTFLPLLLHCSPREDKPSYAQQSSALRTELLKRKLPPLVQVGCDWFPGTPAAFKTEFPNCRIAGSLWHLLEISDGISAGVALPSCSNGPCMS